MYEIGVDDDGTCVGKLLISACEQSIWTNR